MTTRLLVLCLLLSLLRGESPLHSIRGEVYSRVPEDFSWLRLRVLAANERVEVGSTLVRREGRFELTGLPAGVLELQLVDPHGIVAASRFVATPLSGDIRLFIAAPPRPPLETVSLYRLQHRVPGPARSAFAAAMRHLRGHDRAKAVAALDEAIRRDPDFADALEHRGLIAMATQDSEIAVRCLERAAALDAANVQFLTNAGLISLLNADMEKAEGYARAALRFDMSNERAHYVLGLALARSKESLPEAVSELRKAAALFPEVNTLLADLESR